MEQIFANLIGNALNYLDRKRPGRIEVGSLGPEQDNAGAACEPTTFGTRPGHHRGR